MIPSTKYDELKKEISSIHVELDPDPATTGIGQINKRIAEIHAHKERVAAILGDAISNNYERDRVYQELKLDYEMKFEKILNGDDAIKNLKSEGLRTAAVNSRISDEYMKMCSAKIDLDEAEGFLKLIQSKFNQLESSNSSLSRQISVVELQMDIGEIERFAGNPFRERTLSVKRD